MASSEQPTSMENLPHDILRNILIRLRAKQLGQMRCVSKPWEFLLSQPSFIKSHLHRSMKNNDEIFLVLSDGNCYEDTFLVTAHDFSRSPHLVSPNFVKLPAIPPPSPYDEVIFFGSVNGLICYGYLLHFTDFVVHIWNPSLSAVLTVPPSDCEHEFDLLHFRFGYDSTTDDYKIVKLMSCSEPKDYFVSLDRSFVIGTEDIVKVEVYSMRKGSWKLITSELPSHVWVLSDAETVCVDGHDGNLHWLCHALGIRERVIIVSFDLSMESFGEIHLPSSVVDYPCQWHRLGVYSGKLCVTSSNNNHEHEVWVMNEYGVTQSWVKMHVFFSSIIDMVPYGFTLSNKFLFRTLSDRHDFYDPGVEKVESYKIRAGHPEKIKIVRYVDSLVWVAPAKNGVR